MPGRKRLFFIVFDSFGMRRITVVFHRVANDQIRDFPAVFRRF
jgi:hypothetical protein